MTDREKVIKGLNCCKTVGKDFPDCHNCPYTVLPGAECYTGMFCDALELLKEQEPVKPVEHEPYMTALFGDYRLGYDCGACKELIMYKMNFCPWCGRKVKWDD